MGLLKSAFDAVTRLHSQAGYLKRLGTPDIYSPIRMTPSNYFRYLAGPSQTVVTGSECLIPTSVIYGQQSVAVTVNVVPTDGTWTIGFNLNGAPVVTGDLNFDDGHAAIQIALRLITGCENVTVTGDIQTGPLTISFVGVKQIDSVALDLSALIGGTTTATYTYAAIAWPSPLIKRGDRLINSSGTFTVTEVIEMPDIGGDTIGYRTRYE